jgi:RNA polymerase sigma factor (sigma-70 family)
VRISSPTLAAVRRDELDRALLDMLQTLVARTPLFAELRTRGEADDVVQETMIAVSRRIDRGDVDDPHAYATRVVQNLARRRYIRPRRESPAATEDLEAAGPTRDTALTVEQRFELAEVLAMLREVTAVVSELPADAVEVVRAELGRGDQRALAQRLGLSRATFYRRKREVICGFVDAVARRAQARPCPDRVESLLAAAGGSGFARARRAREHAADCPQCATTLRHLTAARHGFAILTPLPALTVVDHGVSDRVGASMHGALDWVRGLAVRAPDPSAALPASKSAVAAIAAACVGVGGTTYCAVDGVPDPVRDVLGLHQSAPPRSQGDARSGARAGATRRMPGSRSPPARAARASSQPGPSTGASAASAHRAKPEFRQSSSATGSADAEFKRAAPRAKRAEFSGVSAATPARPASVNSTPGAASASPEFGSHASSSVEFGP